MADGAKQEFVPQLSLWSGIIAGQTCGEVADPDVACFATDASVTSKGKQTRDGRNCAVAGRVLRTWRGFLKCFSSSTLEKCDTVHRWKTLC